VDKTSQIKYFKYGHLLG